MGIIVTQKIPSFRGFFVKHKVSNFQIFICYGWRSRHPLRGFFAKVAYKIRTVLGGVVNYVDEAVRILDDEIREKDLSYVYSTKV
jgi:hypothetical protein